MTPEALRSELSRLGLSQVEAARRLDVGERTMRRWCAGEIEVPKAVGELLLRLSPKEASKL